MVWLWGIRHPTAFACFSFGCMRLKDERNPSQWEFSGADCSICSFDAKPLQKQGKIR
jgi:hypothetical protein